MLLKNQITRLRWPDYPLGVIKWSTCRADSWFCLSCTWVRLSGFCSIDIFPDANYSAHWLKLRSVYRDNERRLSADGQRANVWKNRTRRLIWEATEMSHCVIILMSAASDSNKGCFRKWVAHIAVTCLCARTKNNNMVNNWLYLQGHGEWPGNPASGDNSH